MTCLEDDYPDQTFDVFDPSEWAKSLSSASTIVSGRAYDGGERRERDAQLLR